MSISLGQSTDTCFTGNKLCDDMENPIGIKMKKVTLIFICIQLTWLFWRWPVGCFRCSIEPDTHQTLLPHIRWFSKSYFCVLCGFEERCYLQLVLHWPIFLIAWMDSMHGPIVWQPNTVMCMTMFRTLLHTWQWVYPEVGICIISAPVTWFW